ncbi:MAG: hypothetical protein ABI609_06300 [Acidobacteriota bacterium]
MMSDWEILETVGTEPEARLIAGFLESREVPVKVEVLAFRQEPVTFGALSQIHLRVPPEFVEEAKRLLQARRHRFAVVDGDGLGPTVATGAPQVQATPPRALADPSDTAVEEDS